MKPVWGGGILLLFLLGRKETLLAWGEQLTAAQLGSLTQQETRGPWPWVQVPSPS